MGFMPSACELYSYFYCVNYLSISKWIIIIILYLRTILLSIPNVCMAYQTPFFCFFDFIVRFTLF